MVRLPRRLLVAGLTLLGSAWLFGVGVGVLIGWQAL